MANKEDLAILNQGVEVWNEWRRETQDHNFEPDLSNADLKGIEIYEADFNCVNFEGSDLSYSVLVSSFLGGAKLIGANLACSNLSFVDFGGANLRDADLRRADISHTHFNGSILDGADLSHALLWASSINGIDLSLAKGLDAVNHLGPSSIGLDTIYKSKGKIPESFLRGCGVPESFITQMHALVGAEDGIQFYSCFISYSSKDEEFARRLHGKMRDAHLRVWFAPEDMKSGAKLHEQIETAIRVYDKLLIVLSEASLQSEWVMTELRKAFKAERREGRRKLFPVRLVDMETIQAWECFDADSGKDLATELREYFIPDFSDWKNHDKFEAAFARLLKDLRDDERKT